MCVPVGLCMCVPVGLCMCVSVGLCMCVSVGLCMCVCVYVCICGTVYVCICGTVYVCICVTVYVCICGTVYVCICVTVYVRIGGRSSNRDRCWRPAPAGPLLHIPAPVGWTPCSRSDRLTALWERNGRPSLPAPVILMCLPDRGGRSVPRHPGSGSVTESTLSRLCQTPGPGDSVLLCRAVSLSS